MLQPDVYQSVTPSVCLSVCLSVISRCSIETAEGIQLHVVSDT